MEISILIRYFFHTDGFPQTGPDGAEDTVVDPADNSQQPEQDTSPPWRRMSIYFRFLLSGKPFPRLSTFSLTSLFNLLIMRNIVGKPRVISTKAFTI